MKKNVWKKPKLVVLVRGKPEEAVLGFCKVEVIQGGPDGGSCGLKEPPPGSGPPQPPIWCREQTNS